MKNIILACILSFASIAAWADQPVSVVLVENDNYTWTIYLESCDINPALPVKVITKQRQFPTDKIIISQGNKKMRCDVKRINVVIA